MPVLPTPGDPYTLGAVWDSRRGGTTFALFSERASRVDLCLFDAASGRETNRISLPGHTEHVWHAFIKGVQPGQHYGYRVHGRWAPREGLRFRPSKLLVDPYARALAGPVDWNKPRCVVVASDFDWGADRRPETPWAETIVYEAHVKGLTMAHPDVPEPLRGTYAGLASPPVIEHLKSLGITAVELMPVHQFVSDQILVDRGLTNYWGYNSIGYFAPESHYSSSGERGEQVDEFKQMVKALHAAGLEVILDVVYNHTAEGNHLGPTLSFRGVDNTTYYNLVDGQPRYYTDFTGTGNTLNVHHPQTLKLIADSLRYWVQEMHVDGFRFDLAITLARDPVVGYDKGAGFFDIVHQDPVLSRVKLIAEPWDVGDHGYQVGNFPTIWSEWNGRYRDNVRKFWKGDEGQVTELASRLSGSSDLYRISGRGPRASVNFITAHDGFTLRDLVTYNDKHNEANGENNQDGASDNASWNSGAEGPTSDAEVETLRLQRQRSLLATLMFSQGVPMLLGGDEMGRSQRGNNNAYCQDNDISWVDWNLDDDRRDLLGFTQRIVGLRKRFGVLHRSEFFTGRPVAGLEIPDLSWFNADGTEVDDGEWGDPLARSLGMRLAGVDEAGSQTILCLLVNAYWEELRFVLPAAAGRQEWQALLDTHRPDVGTEADRDPRLYAAGHQYPLAGRSLVLLRAGT